MFTFDVVGSAWLFATAGAFVPSLLFIATERTVKPVKAWFASHDVKSPLGCPLSG